MFKLAAALVSVFAVTTQAINLQRSWMSGIDDVINSAMREAAQTTRDAQNFARDTEMKATRSARTEQMKADREIQQTEKWAAHQREIAALAEAAVRAEEERRRREREEERRQLWSREGSRDTVGYQGRWRDERPASVDIEEEEAE